MNKPPDDLARILESEHTPVRRYLRWIIIGILALAIGATIAYFLMRAPEDGGARYVTEEVQRGNLVVTVSATGRLQPTNQVDVGSELSGTIAEVLVDDNDRVTRGQVLARLDVSRLKDQVAKSRAALAAAQA